MCAVAKKPKPKYVGVLLNLMGEKKESQSDLAKAIGTNRDRINNWIADRSKLDFENLIKIAEHYDVTTDYLLGVTTVRKQDANLRSIEEYTGLSADAIESIIDDFKGFLDSDLSAALCNDSFCKIFVSLHDLRFACQQTVLAMHNLTELQNGGDIPLDDETVYSSEAVKRVCEWLGRNDDPKDVIKYAEDLFLQWFREMRVQTLELNELYYDFLEAVVPTKEVVEKGKEISRALLWGAEDGKH